PDSKRATFEVREGGGERVLFGRLEGRRWRRLARGASPIDAWTVMPHGSGALALDGSARRGVVLGEGLEPTDPPPRGVATLVDVARERFRSSDLDVKLYALGLALFPLLFARAIAAEIKRRGSGGDARRAVLPLVAWAVIVAVFVLVRRGALF